MSDDAVEIFRSRGRAASDDRSFMLAAVGIPSTVAFDGGEFVLLVAAGHQLDATAHLRQYEIETRNRPAPAPPPPPLHPHAWLGSLLYLIVLFGVTLAIANGLWRLDAFDAGELDAGRIQGGQLWRAWTALTLHLDGPHLVANAVAGAWFGYLAGRLLGVGNAWLLVVAGAGVANLIEGYFGPAAHRSVGASTAVFTALGLLSAFSWRTRFKYPQRWASRWGPLIAGVILLGWTGTGGEAIDSPSHGDQAGGSTVDVVAHALGFSVGILLGALAASEPMTRLLNRMPQWLAGIAALAPIAVSWLWALYS